MASLSVIIPFYKDIETLKKNLEKNVRFLRNCEIIIVNDSPEISLEKEIPKATPNLRIVTNQKNSGFGVSVNNGVKASSSPYIMLLNTDVVLHDNSFLTALAYFEKDTNLFAVSFAQSERSGETVGANEGYFDNGMFHHRKKEAKKLTVTLWPEGGSCVILKEKFEKLEGFDPDYAPFYWEDVDLGYRATKKGWKSIFDPEIKVDHHHETTIGAYFTHDQVTTIATRNQFLFVWKNIRGIQLLQHIILLPRIILSQRANRPFIEGFKQALSKFLTNPHV